MSASADVVVIGGGIAGCATAYQLARRGHEVTLLEKGDIGYEQSTRNWGWIHQQIRHPQLVALAVQSVRIWRQLADELGSETGWVQGGNLSLAFDERDLQDFDLWQRTAAEYGLESEVLSRSEVAALLPQLRGDWLGGLHVPSDGQADPALVTEAYAGAGEALGVTIRRDCAALRIELRGGQVSGVLTEHGPVSSSTVVCAAGSWSGRLLRGIGVKIPQRSLRSTVVRTTPVARLTEMTAWGDGVTFRQDALGRFILAGGARSIYDLDADLLRDVLHFVPAAWTNRRWVRLRAGRRLLADLAAVVPHSAARREFWQRRRRVDPPPDEASVRESLARFREMFPHLEVTVDRAWAGYIDSTPDQAPVLGAVDGIDGLQILTGLSGHGFALAPAAAQLLAELIDGDPPSVNPTPFRHARFVEGDLAPAQRYRR